MCSATFATRDQLYSHLPQHKFQQRFDCPICRLWYQTALQLHEHRIAEPFYCGKYYGAGLNTATPQQQHHHQSQTNYKLQDCHMATMESRCRLPLIAIRLGDKTILEITLGTTQYLYKICFKIGLINSLVFGSFVGQSEAIMIFLETEHTYL